jgi:acetyl esterase
MARRAFRDFLDDHSPPLPTMASRTSITIPTRGGHRPALVLRPTEIAQTLPILTYFHSGGYVIGGLSESEGEARRLAIEIPAIVVSVSYRLAPEHRFPAAAEDALDAVCWVAENARDLGGDPARLAVAGCSAGGGLAAVAAGEAAAKGRPRLALALLLCPWLDLTLSHPSVSAHGRGYDLDREMLDWFVGAYAGSPGETESRLASPALHPISRGMPPTIILAAEHDPLVDEARHYADALRIAGAAATLIPAPGMIHAFNEIPHLVPAGGQLLQPVFAATRSVIAAA